MKICTERLASKVGISHAIYIILQKQMMDDIPVFEFALLITLCYELPTQASQLIRTDHSLSADCLRNELPYVCLSVCLQPGGMDATNT